MMRRKNDYQSHILVPTYYLVNILVKESTNIPKSILKYSVKVASDASLFDGKTGKKTSEIMALLNPKWNQMLTFIIERKDLYAQKTIKMALQFSLCCTDKKLNAEHKIELRSLIASGFVEFPKETVDKKFIKVGIEATITSYREVLKERLYSETGVSCTRIPLLCKQERDFVIDRRSFVFDKMKKDKLQIYHKEEVPKIAIIGSGGGMRAVIGMCGAVTALEDLGILDYAMYMAGVSGSAWYITTLYANEKKLNPKAVNDCLKKNFGVSFLNSVWQTWYSWKSYTKSKSFSHGKYFTTTDSFGEMIGAILLGKKCKQKWSDQRKKLEHGHAPLPLLSALQVRDEQNQEVNAWVEFSPYEVGIPTYGVSINMTEFGERFYGGFVTKSYGEQPIHYLQGLCGSAYAKALDPKKSEGEWFWYLGKLCTVKDWLWSWFDKPADEIVARVPNWLQGILTTATRTVNGAVKEEEFVDGKKEQMLLIDAGLEFNLPYPAVLHPARNVDLILSFDFSFRGGGTKSPFEELKKAEQWAKQKKVPFPKIETDGKNEPYQELYIFEGGDDEPTILHFLMINNRFRKLITDENKDCKHMFDFDIFSDYHTLRFSYTEPEFERLKMLIEYNVFISHKDIERHIEKAIQKNSKKSMPTYDDDFFN